MTDPFATLVSPVFAQVIDLLDRIDRDESPALEPERDAIVAALAEAGQKAAASSQLLRDFEVARYALVYWADEVLINSHWRHATEWRQRILEWDFFNDRIRADAFFERMEQAERLDSADPLEVYLICLALGFRGRYVDGPVELRTWVDRAYRRVVSASAGSESFLPPEPAAGKPLEPLPGQSILLAVSVVVSLTVLFTLACFVMAIPPWE